MLLTHLIFPWPWIKHQTYDKIQVHSPIQCFVFGTYNTKCGSKYKEYSTTESIIGIMFSEDLLEWYHIWSDGKNLKVK